MTIIANVKSTSTKRPTEVLKKEEAIKWTIMLVKDSQGYDGYHWYNSSTGQAFIGESFPLHALRHLRRGELSAHGFYGTMVETMENIIESNRKLLNAKAEGLIKHDEYEIGNFEVLARNITAFQAEYLIDQHKVRN